MVFGSPLFLKLELVCTVKTPARDTLDVWPPLPLIIWGDGYFTKDLDFTTKSVDYIIAALERRNRVGQIDLSDIPAPSMKELFAAVQGPFPELTLLRLHSSGDTGSVVPNSFLGGSAPRLQEIWLHSIPFPGLPKLLLSATRLVNLHLRNISHSGYIAPEVMATALSTSTCLRSLAIEFRSPQSFPDQESRRPPPLTRSVLPVLTEVEFQGSGYYLEYLVAHLDAPQLNWFYTTFFNQIGFDTPQFIQFMNRTPKLKALEKGYVSFRDKAAKVRLSPASPPTSLYVYEGLYVTILSRGTLDRQVLCLEQVLTLSVPFSALEDLYIYKYPHTQSDWQDDIGNAMWLELLHPFPAVKNLYICDEFAPRIMPALQELVGVRTTEVLPNLQNIFLAELQSSELVQESIREFVAARQVTSHPIAISPWDNFKQDKYCGRW